MNTAPLKSLPPVGRIEGLVLQPSGTADPSVHRIEIQYTGRTPDAGTWHRLEMPLLDALYLLNLLEAMSKDNGFDHLRKAAGRAH